MVRNSVSLKNLKKPTHRIAPYQVALGTKEDAKSLNAYLDTLQAKVHEIHHLINEEQCVSAQKIRDRLTGTVEHKRMILEIFADMLSRPIR